MVTSDPDTLTRIADLLENDDLGDPEILQHAAWSKRVLPITRPFLDLVENHVGRNMSKHTGGDARRKRDSFDRRILKLGPKLEAQVLVGAADDSDQRELEHCLVWGLRAESAEGIEKYGELLRGLVDDDFKIKEIDTSKSVSYPGRNALLYRAVQATELRDRDSEDLARLVGTDLKRLIAAAEAQVEPIPTLRSSTAHLSARALSDWLMARHSLRFSPNQVATLVTALQAKGFVILSGISGTGKTQIAGKISELALGRPVEIVPVKPDWRDSRSILGFYNHLTGHYSSTPVLRQILGNPPAERPPTESPADDIRSWVIEKVKGRGGWAWDLKDIVETFEKSDPGALTDQDVDRIWRQRGNGVTDLGQAVANRLNGTYDELRQATAILADKGTPGEKLVDVMAFLRAHGNQVRHWSRCLRALANFNIDQTCAISDQKALGNALQRLGYGEAFNLPHLVQATDTTAINAAFAFIRQRIDEDFPELDRYEKAIAPWYLSQYPEGDQDALETERREPADGSAPEQHFIILDEMNLARVEYYFAEFLSVLESDRDSKTGRSVQAMPLHGERDSVRDGDGEDALHIPPSLHLPSNLYVIGTVNTDETTHAFSPKVLDRAFTIEFRDVDLASASVPGTSVAPEGSVLGPELSALLIQSSDPSRRATAKSQAQSRPEFISYLQSLNRLLEPHDLHFAYRVRDEVARFVGFALESPLRDGFELDKRDVFMSSMDAAILMKVLPKFHGSKSKLLEPLLSVLSWCADPEHPVDTDRMSKLRTELDNPGGASIGALLSAAATNPVELAFPLTARKVARMLVQCVNTGFASFA